MQNDITTLADDWLEHVPRLPSPNCNARPPGSILSLLVIHGISLPAGKFGGNFIHQLFTNSLDCNAHPALADLLGVEVSAHLLIDRQGSLTQFVPFNKRAWHAGVSAWCGVANCNDYSIGIELEGDDSTPYTAAQYDALTQVTRAIMQRYPAITLDRIVGHCDIAPGRKSDPGPSFDWDGFRRRLSKPALKNTD